LKLAVSLILLKCNDLPLAKRIGLNNTQLEIARCLCLARDGYLCIMCKKPFSQNNQAEVHHIDGNPNNNPQNGKNWGLVHHTCNIVEYYVRKRFDALSGERPSPFEYKIGTKMELNWIRWMIDYLSENHRIKWDQARYTGALEIDASPETTKRYLMKHVADSDHLKALFRLVQDASFENWIVFTNHIQDFVDQNKQFQ